MAEATRKRQRGSAFARMIAIAGALVLGGCQTLVPKGPPPPVQRAPTGPVRQTPPPIQAGIPEDTERNRVALLVPLSGANAGVGQSLANATQLALLDADSKRVRITTYDTNKGAVVAVQRALADGNRLILGPLLAEDVRAVAPIARGAHVPVISFSNDLSVAGNGAYVLGYSPAQSIARVVDYAHAHGVTNFAGLMPNSLYGERASTSFLRAVEDAGGQVVSLQTYDRGANAIAAAVTRMARNSPYDAVLIADGGAAAAAAVPLVRKNGGGSARILGTELWNSERSLISKPAMSGAWFASVSDGLYLQYAAKYRARFGSAPYRLSSLGYDAVLLTIRISRDWPIGRDFPEGRLTDKGGFAGIDGPFRFDRDGVAQRALEVQEIRGGTTVTVSPAPRDFGK